MREDEGVSELNDRIWFELAIRVSVSDKETPAADNQSGKTSNGVETKYRTRIQLNFDSFFAKYVAKLYG